MTAPADHQKVLIVDFGSQVTQLIARRLREARVYCEIHPYAKAEAALAKLEEELAAPDAWDTPDRSAKNTERHTAAKRAVEEAYARWEAASA